jgi:altronate hydrolase
MNARQPTIIRLHERDNVAVTLLDLAAGEAIASANLTARDHIPAGHKVAIRRINLGDPVLKFGQIIGFAAAAIGPGEHVHTHNLKIRNFQRDYKIGTDSHPTELVSEAEHAHFEGIVRADGRVATRNYIGVLATVNCSASVSRFIADEFNEEMLTDFSNVDGVVALGHGTGCGMNADSQGFKILQRTLAGYTRHPNFGAILLVGLGCEVNLVDCLMQNMNLAEGPLLKTINIQTAGGTRQSVRQGVSTIQELLPEVNRVERCTVAADHIILGLECGGSDAYSGISANPALGAAADLLVRHGGTAILSETPEIYGAEHLLTRRAVSRAVGEKLVARVKWWETYTASLGGEINNNPTPGNKAGGLTTILEKSLGAAAKGGTTTLMQVYEYAEPVLSKGLVFMDTPGYDATSITGMVAGGANIVCFTTGRGTVCGFKPVPTIKLASNTAMFQQMKGDMDINCGRVINGEASIREMGQEIFGAILEVASGKKVKSEILGFGDNEFVPWHIGAVM